MDLCLHSKLAHENIFAKRNSSSAKSEKPDHMFLPSHDSPTGSMLSPGILYKLATPAFRHLENERAERKRERERERERERQRQREKEREQREREQRERERS